MIVSWKRVYGCRFCGLRMLTMDAVWEHFYRMHCEVLYTSIIEGLGLYVCTVPRVTERRARQ